MPPLIMPVSAITQLQAKFVNELKHRNAPNISVAIDPAYPKGANVFGVVPNTSALITITVGFLRWLERIADGNHDPKAALALRKSRETFAQHFPNASVTHIGEIDT